MNNIWSNLNEAINLLYIADQNATNRDWDECAFYCEEAMKLAARATRTANRRLAEEEE